MTPLHFIEEKKNGAILCLRIQPGAARNEICGLHGRALKIRLCAPPVEGAANKALIAFLAKALGLRKSDLCLTSGQRSKDKKILIQHMSAEELRKIFLDKYKEILKEKR